jgi:hypothetical protein
MGLGDSRQMFMRILIPNKPFVVDFGLVSTIHDHVQEYFKKKKKVGLKPFKISNKTLLEKKNRMAWQETGRSSLSETFFMMCRSTSEISLHSV